jgi:hypothetical protein
MKEELRCKVSITSTHCMNPVTARLILLAVGAFNALNCAALAVGRPEVHNDSSQSFPLLLRLRRPVG